MRNSKSHWEKTVNPDSNANGYKEHWTLKRVKMSFNNKKIFLREGDERRHLHHKEIFDAARKTEIPQVSKKLYSWNHQWILEKNKQRIKAMSTSGLF